MLPTHTNTRWLVSFLHRFPHLNTTLNRVNSTFDSRSESYLESLGILASVPALLLITSLSLLLLYLVTRCCDGNGKQSTGGGCCVRFVLVLVAVGSCLSSSLSLYANDDLHNSLATVVQSVRSIDLYIRHLSLATHQMEASLGSTIPMNISVLANVFEKPLLNRTAYTELQVSLDYLRRNASWTLTNIQLFNDKYFGLIDSNQYARLAESIRWPTTVALQSVFIVLNLLLLYAVGRGSRCSYITFSVLGLLALIINWSLVSVYLLLSVSLADVCSAPSRIISIEVPLLTSCSRDLISYYINCGGETGSQSPLLQEIGFIGGCVEATRVVLKELKDDAVRFYDGEKVTPPIESIMDQLHSLDMTLQDLESSDCQQPYNEYKRAVEAGCGVGLFGLALLLASSAVSALLFTVGVGFDSHAWIYGVRRGSSTGGTLQRNGGSSKGSKSHHHQEPQHYQQQPPPIGAGRNGHQYEHDSFLPPQPYQQQYQQHYSTQPRTGHHHSQHQQRGGPQQYGTTARHHGHYNDPPPPLRPNNGQYATLSRACKTLEANDFY